MIVLDTNVLYEFARPSPSAEVTAWLRAQRASDIHTTAISLFEMLDGGARLPHGARREALGTAVSGQFAALGGRILPFDVEAAAHCVDIVRMRSTAGAPISMADAQIASIARSRGFALATRNLRDFAETGVEVIDPWSFDG